MAHVDLENPFRSIQGKFTKEDHIIYRQKHIHSSGKSAIYFPMEAYAIAHPRDYKKNPPRGNELANIQAFQQASLLAKQQLADPAARSAWEQRFQAQLSRPDVDAPADPITKKRKIYRHFPSYVRATLLRQIKADQQTNQATE